MENFTLRVKPLALHPTIDNTQKYDLSHFCVLPMSILQKIDNAGLIDRNPYCFKLNTIEMVRDIYVSVIEFSAEDGTIYLPKILMDNNFVSTDDLLLCEYIEPPKGSNIILQPENEIFHNIENNKELLENHISNNYKILQIGDRIGFTHGDDNIFLEITYLEPCDVISAHETEMVLDYHMTLKDQCNENKIKREESVMKKENQFLADLHRERMERMNRNK